MFVKGLGPFKCDVFTYALCIAEGHCSHLDQLAPATDNVLSSWDLSHRRTADALLTNRNEFMTIHDQGR